jgi:hypothetical protein
MGRRPASCLRNAHGVCSRSIASDQIAPEKMRRGKMRPTTTPDKADFAAPSLSGTNASRGDGDQRTTKIAQVATRGPSARYIRSLWAAICEQ